MRRAAVERRAVVVDRCFSKTSGTDLQRRMRLLARALGIPVFVTCRRIEHEWRIYALPLDDATLSA